MLLGVDSRVIEESTALRSLTQGARWTDIADRRWLSLCAPGGDRYVALLSTPDLRDTASVTAVGVSLIARLELAGVLVVRERPDDHPYPLTVPYSTVRLFGGSVCSTYLDLDALVVRKSLRPTQLDSQDGRDRHQLEFAFMSAIPTGCRHLFPKARLLRSPTSDHALTLEMDFVRGYSLGERVLRGEVTGHRLCALVDELTNHLRQSLWSSRPCLLQRSYFDVIRRRFSHLLNGRGIFARLWTAGATVNGIHLGGLEKLVASAERQWPQLASLQGSGAHGDLILDDILLVQYNSGHEIKLVDPNPQNVSWFIDMAKLMMSARLKYEVIYSGRYECAWSIQDDVFELSFAITDSRSWSCLDDLAEHLAQRAEMMMVEHPESLRRILLEVQACLNMLALPSFHHIHHQEYERSVMFTVLGMSRLQQLLG